jgi:hypothetical protein
MHVCNCRPTFQDETKPNSLLPLPLLLLLLLLLLCF